MSQKQSTTTFMRKISKARNIASFISENEDEFSEVSFQEMIQEICTSKNLVREHIIQKAQIERTYGHQLFNGTRKPSRDKVIQVGIALELNLEEMQKLLQSANKSALYPKVKRDAVIIFAIERHKNMNGVQELLEELNLPILGTN